MRAISCENRSRFDFSTPVCGVALLVMILMSGSTNCIAKPAIRDSFFSVYPWAVGTALDSLPSRAGHCGVCHYDFLNGGATRTLYGDALAAIGGLNKEPGRISAINTLHSGDQDGDGFLTATEMDDAGLYGNTPTFPGLSAAHLANVLNIPQSEITPYLTPSVSVDTTPPEVSVVSPNGGEVWTSNQAYTIQWTASDASGIAAIHLYESLDGGTSFSPVELGLANTGNYSWMPANRPSANAIIRVVAVDGAANTNSDESDAVYTIHSPVGGRVSTTLRDFDMPGSQPFEGGPEATDPAECAKCHGNYDTAVEPYRNWQGSLMSQASIDPLFLANMTIANQDAPESGDLCLRCHHSRGWLQGRSTPTDGSRMEEEDLIGVSCDQCHRMLDPIYKEGISPARDADVIAALEFPGTEYGNGMQVIDPSGIQRGPFADARAPHQFVESSFHQSSAFCGTCHDVSNPAFTKDEDGIYQPNEFDATATNFSAHSLGPVERTYSEWLNSAYNSEDGVYQPEFAGNKADGMVSSCQDCHMHDVLGAGCNVAGAPIRGDMPLHDMTGGSTWLPGLLPGLYPDRFDEASIQALQDGMARATRMLENAAELEVSVSDDDLVVKVTNQTGHKLPTGYPEGRRIWINVKFFDSGGAVISESGAYDPNTGVLSHDAEVKIYEVHPGIGENISEVVGLPAGPSLHFVLNNQIYEDNRIPPRGFTNAAFEEFGGAPVGHAYADGQYWDNTPYTIPAGAVRAEVRLHYQSTSKEFIEFLRDENTTDNLGQQMYDLWKDNGKCPPVLMAEAEWQATPVVFSGVQSVVAGVESATLSWLAAASGCPPVTYQVYQSTTSVGQDFSSPVLTTENLSEVISLDPGSSSRLTYYFVARATDACGGNENNTVEMSVQPLIVSTKDQDGDGMTNAFEELYLLDPFSAVDALQDLDFDDLTNLEEDVFGSNPLEAASAHRLRAIKVDVGGIDYLALSYTRKQGVLQAQIVVEVSDDLVSWNAGPAFTSTVSVTDKGDGLDTVIERVNDPMIDSTAYFMRIQVIPN